MAIQTRTLCWPEAIDHDNKVHFTVSSLRTTVAKCVSPSHVCPLSSSSLLFVQYVTLICAGLNDLKFLFPIVKTALCNCFPHVCNGVHLFCTLWKILFGNFSSSCLGYVSFFKLATLTVPLQAVQGKLGWLGGAIKMICALFSPVNLSADVSCR